MSATPSCALPRAARSSTTVYRPRRPEKTVVELARIGERRRLASQLRPAVPMGHPRVLLGQARCLHSSQDLGETILFRHRKKGAEPPMWLVDVGDAGC